MKQYDMTIYGKQNKVGIALPVRHGKVVFVEDLRKILEEKRDYFDKRYSTGIAYSDRTLVEWKGKKELCKELLAELNPSPEKKHSRKKSVWSLLTEPLPPEYQKELEKEDRK